MLALFGQGLGVRGHHAAPADHGARRADIRRLVIGNGLGVTAVGIAIGLAGAYALARFRSSLLYEVTPGEPVTVLRSS